MTQQVTIRDEDLELARDIAGRLGTSLDDAVAKALHDLDRRIAPGSGLEPGQQVELDTIRALVAEARQHIVPGAFNDHGWLYDWNGLPA